ncbi:putative toxin-antitoxin system toxin component, PIN family [Hymenobacter properus]|uniref:Toxin-antitoxin system toxin component, PIN family n=1 Tax=Hymenobacter properus TaxID=2791026 RepID=A0A931BGY3_9BACT|nr:putative toxin-antitoxin system toxin component, PIN family [Hymenobacter properus]MBF9143750.1 putative toxin-antitoxin system toxin component, PIN family [Hymenobacter properus]MBR7722563.1 putative toxin-antitoxin system toxin component, PIN family [Microvirga sp. SRT04]
MPGANKLRVIADSNAWISRFILPNSLTGQRMKRLAADKRITLVFSQALKDELRAVLQRPKFRKYITAENLAVFRAYLDAFPTTPVTSAVALCRDPKDNFLLNLALDSQADYLLTGDEDLLVLGRVGSTSILTLADFAQQMGLGE